MAIKKIVEYLKYKSSDLDIQSDISANILLALSGDNGGNILVSLKDGKINILEVDEDENSALQISTDIDTASAIFDKKMDFKLAFLTGKIKVTGDMGLITQIKNIF